MNIDYKLIYWPIPFRANFILSLLEYKRCHYELSTQKEVLHYKAAACINQPIAGMAPPVLIDYASGQSINQMPAIVFYLARKLQLFPVRELDQAMTLKIVLDSNDVLSDLTNANGSVMWQPGTWRAFRSQRFVRWLEIFNQMLQYNSCQFMFEDQVGCADLVIFALFGTMMRCLPPLSVDIKRHAPAVYTLCQTLAETEQMKEWFERQQTEFGDVYCGGQIESSIRDMLIENT